MVFFDPTIEIYLFTRPNDVQRRHSRESGNPAFLKPLGPRFRGDDDIGSLSRELVTLNKNARGFTLLELVVVLVVIGVMSAAAVNKLQTPGNQSLAYQAELLSSDLRHAQSLALSWSTALKVNLTATGYSVQCVAAAATPPCNSSPVIDPASSSAFDVALDNGVQLSGTGFVFDTMGRPRDSATNALLSSKKLLTLTADGLSWQVGIAPITGFVDRTRL